MSRITRKLHAEHDRVTVAGADVGGGIVLTPKKPKVECEECVPGGDCVADNFQAMWFYINSSNPKGVLTSDDLSFYEDNIWPGSSGQMLIGMVVDPAITQPEGDVVTQICCGSVQWGITISGDISYTTVNGLLIVTDVGGSGDDITATPTVCDADLSPLTYVHEGI